MKPATLVVFAVLALVGAAPAAAESQPLPGAEPPDFVDRYVVGHPVETPDFVDRYVVRESQPPPDFVDRFVVGHGVQRMDSADRYAAGRVVHTPDFVDRYVAREIAGTTVASATPASSSDDGRTLPLAALLALAGAVLATVTVVLRRREPQTV